MPPAAATDESTTHFEHLVDLHYRSLYRFALSLCGSEATAADLVQQTFYRWAAKGHQLRDRSKVKTWLFTTLHREFLQHVRRDVRLVALPEEDEITDQRRSSATEAALALDTETVFHALSEVEDTFRVPLSLFYLEEFSYAEIAEMLGIPVGTVMSRLSRGKERLRHRVLALRSNTTSETKTFPPAREVPRRG